VPDSACLAPFSQHEYRWILNVVQLRELPALGFTRISHFPAPEMEELANEFAAIRYAAPCRERNGHCRHLSSPLRKFLGIATRDRIEHLRHLQTLP
jgi:hypothetical protein